ncbi:hypothetical protein HanRHA438_Chr12g0532641 [Helianthus annuus]|nr:hypothetical protein HanRHA438_Chr12g0532641 [Helianthus annuus]
MMWICNSSETARFTGDGHRSRNFSIAKDEEDDRDSSSSSSIGNNSDASGGACDSDDGGEVQSLFKGSLNNLSDLEEALAVKYDFISYTIYTFYCMLSFFEFYIYLMRTVVLWLVSLSVCFNYIHVQFESSRTEF